MAHPLDDLLLGGHDEGPCLLAIDQGKVCEWRSTRRGRCQQWVMDGQQWVMDVRKGCTQSMGNSIQWQLAILQPMPGQLPCGHLTLRGSLQHR